MVSYVAHIRKGPATGGCGCGGSRAPIPLSKEEVDSLNNHLFGNTDKKKNVTQSANINLEKPKNVTEKTTPVDLKNNSKNKPEQNTFALVNDLREYYNRNGISRENSYNKMNLPRKGCCGH